jgi:hypothetical protein
MALGRKMHHRIGPEVPEGGFDRLEVADVGREEMIVWTVGNRIERTKVRRVSKLVDIENFGAGVHEVPAESGADEPCSAGDDDTRLRIHCSASARALSYGKTSFNSSRGGWRRSRSDRTAPAVGGQSMPMAGSFHARPRSYDAA